MVYPNALSKHRTTFPSSLNNKNFQIPELNSPIREEISIYISEVQKPEALKLRTFA